MRSCGQEPPIRSLLQLENSTDKVTGSAVSPSTEAFRRYKATLKNINWSVCAENPDGELVVSLWKHHFGKSDGNTIRCKDRASRWSGAGNNEFRKALDKAKETDQVIRVVLARTESPDAVESGKDASKLKNTFSVKEDWFGKLIVWDGDNYEIEFTSKEKGG